MSLNSDEIQMYLPNSYPWLFVDEITEVIPGEKTKGYKELNSPTWYLSQYFQTSNVPDFILLEAMIEVFIITFLTLKDYKGMRTGDVCVDYESFSTTVSGNRLELEAFLHSFRRGVARGDAFAYINGNKICRSSLTVAIPDIVKKFCPR